VRNPLPCFEPLIPSLGSVFDLLKSHTNGNVAYNSLERKMEHVSICKEGTRERVLDEIIQWAEETQCSQICWLHGHAGTGKSTIAQTIAERYDEQNKLAFSYFFSRRNPDHNDMSKFIPTFACQLASVLPSLREPIKNALSHDPLVLTRSPEDVLRRLIIKPFNHISKPSSPMVIVIDGLDEYNQNEGRIPLSDLILLLAGPLLQLPFRLLLTSRPEAYIEAIFSTLSSPPRRIALQDYSASKDIYDYLLSELSKVQMSGRSGSWPSTEVLQRLTDQSEGIFIYASTLVKFIGNEYEDPNEMLQIALNAHKGLDSIYEQVLANAKKYRYIQFEGVNMWYLPGRPSQRNNQLPHTDVSVDQ
jgi:hypothetical protein